MSAKRPVIAVTGPDRGGWPAWIFTALAVRRAGAKPLRLRPLYYSEGENLPHFDGLILGGGADIEPTKAGIPMDEVLPPKKRKEDVEGRVLAWVFAPFIFLLRSVLSVHHAEVETARDAFEETCLKLALKNGLPILGICRGAQLINIHFGGTLHAELSSFYGESGNPDSVYPRKRVEVEEDSLLKKVIGEPVLLVNSLHKQAVNKLGDGVKVTAMDNSGVTQAIEVRDNGWILGVQWHPEYLPTLNRHQRIFRALVSAARRG